MEAECKTGEVTKGLGATIYHSVNSIEEVSSITAPIPLPRIFQTYRATVRI